MGVVKSIKYLGERKSVMTRNDAGGPSKLE